MSKHFTAARTLSRKIENYLDGVLGYTGDDGIPMNTSTSADAFGRLRVSNPITLFESQHRYEDNGKWDNAISGTAGTTYLVNESTVKLTAANGGSITRETSKVFNYQPGKSLLIMNSFALSASTVGVTQRIGYYNNQNGIYLQQDGHADGPALVLRSYVTGSTDNSRLVRRTSWNCDMFDGTGPSRRTLDLTKANIFWMDIEWLGVGAVRCGFVVDGKFHVAHTFFNDNLNSASYMTTAVLPLRAELINTTSTSPFIKQICNTVISEGGHNPESLTYCQASSASVFVTRQTNGTTADRGKFFNTVSIRLASSKLDGIIIPTGVSIVIEQNKKYQWALIKNATFATSPTWTVHPDCATAEITISDSIMTGGTIVKSGFITNASESVILNDLGSQFLQLGRTQAGVSDVYTLAIAADATNSTFNTLLSWYQIV
jgi:hypothetical protein